MEYRPLSSIIVKKLFNIWRALPGTKRTGLAFTFLVVFFQISVAQAVEQWTTSKLVGSPEPPLPYQWQRIHPELDFTGAISINRCPNSSIFLVLEHQGNIYSFDDRQEDAKAHLVWNLAAQRPRSANFPPSGDSWIRLYSCTFDPDYANNHFCYLCYVVESPKGAKTYISRFSVTNERPFEIDRDSELNIIQCDGGGHNGCTLAFGPDGNLYASLGDLGDANPPDGRNTGQDISDLYASILRIDIRNATQERPYTVPADNPFVNTPNAAPEVYAYGLRNPFRICFDPASGELWAADVGWETWELVYRIKSGGNYGWSVKEGNGNAKMGKLGPTPILSPDVELPHSIAASITGGMFYYGKKLPELNGKYICGDWVTRKFWSIAKDGPDAMRPVDIAESEVKPICFEIDQDGEILVLDYNEMNTPSGVYRLVRNVTANTASASFPMKLSDTGLFKDVSKHEPAAGVFSYSINETMWMEGAHAEFLVALPNESQISVYQNPQVMFNWYMTKVRLPIGGVLAKTYRLAVLNNGNTVERRVETQIELKDESGKLQYYTYRWLDDQSDAYLVSKEGETAQFNVPDSRNLEGLREVKWSFANRTQCRVCHTPWVGETVGFTEYQLRRPKQNSDSWRQLLVNQRIRYFHEGDPTDDAHYRGLVSSNDTHECVENRARAYLHANCSHCHLRGGNASTSFDLRFEKTAREMEAYDLATMRGGLGLVDPKIIAAGSPSQSVLWLRMATAGTGHMPQAGSTGIDADGVALIANWISSIPRSAELRSNLDAIVAPSDSSYSDEQRLSAATELLKSTEGVMLLANAFANNAIVPWMRREIISRAMSTDGPMRELLEPYAAGDQRPKRLGASFSPSAILDLKGSADKGKELFRSGIGSCNGCHQLQGTGRDYGPDLSKLSNPKWSKSDVLDQIMKPSATIHAQYGAMILLTDEGNVVTGIVVGDDEKNLTVRDSNGVSTVFKKANIEEIRRSEKSIMPENLLDALTAQQAADLLEYVWAIGH